MCGWALMPLCRGYLARVATWGGLPPLFALVWVLAVFWRAGRAIQPCRHARAHAQAHTHTLCL
eukprot:10138130-Alexandrium_andersonii.AAC.1